MSFRDDHDAAISRIAALEHELASAQDQAREKSQRDRDRIAMLEREIDELRRKEPSAPRPRAPSTPPVRKPVASAAEPLDELATKGPAISRALLGMLLVFALGTGLLIYFALRTSDEPVKGTCTVATSPYRATVVGFANAREVNLGVAPVELRFGEWVVYDKIELRLPGWETMTIDPPSTFEACPSSPYELRR